MRLKDIADSLWYSILQRFEKECLVVTDDSGLARYVLKCKGEVPNVTRPGRRLLAILGVAQGGWSLDKGRLSSSTSGPKGKSSALDHDHGEPLQVLSGVSIRRDCQSTEMASRLQS